MAKTEYSVKRSELGSQYFLMEGEKVSKIFMNSIKACAELDRLEALNAREIIIVKKNEVAK